MNFIFSLRAASFSIRTRNHHFYYVITIIIIMRFEYRIWLYSNIYISLHTNLYLEYNLRVIREESSGYTRAAPVQYYSARQQFVSYGIFSEIISSGKKEYKLCHRR